MMMAAQIPPITAPAIKAVRSPARCIAKENAKGSSEQIDRSTEAKTSTDTRRIFPGGLLYHADCLI